MCGKLAESHNRCHRKPADIRSGPKRVRATNRAMPNRRRTAKLFDRDKYRLRALIEGVCGAEESKDHQLRCRFVRTDNRRRFGKIRATT